MGIASMEHYDILIVGGGAAGISAAKAAKGKKVILAEREEKLGQEPGEHPLPSD